MHAWDIGSCVGSIHHVGTETNHNHPLQTVDVNGEEFAYPMSITAFESSWLNDAGELIISEIPTVPGASALQQSRLHAN
ncbi:MAG: hypothetical protein EBS29_13180 [Chloroflexia bacterium]|nr:hypothetical protein [Chloroflexia bacterium]